MNRSQYIVLFIPLGGNHRPEFKPARVFSVPIRPYSRDRRGAPFSYPDYSATAKAERRPAKKAPRTAEAVAAAAAAADLWGGRRRHRHRRRPAKGLREVAAWGSDEAKVGSADRASEGKEAA